MNCVTCGKDLGESNPEKLLAETGGRCLSCNELELLRDPKLFDKLDDEIGKVVEGEKPARRALLLFSWIRLVKNRGRGAASNLLVNSASSAGKGFVTGATLDVHPREFVERLGTASANSFKYWHANDQEFTWDGKVCLVTELSNQLMESDHLKAFLSDAEKSIVVNKSGKGQNEAQELAAHGKPVFIGCTATIEPNEEILNRCNIISLDESAEQTKAIVGRQLKHAAGGGKDALFDPGIIAALRKLGQVSVTIPWAEKLAPFMPSALRARRDVPRILNLVRASAALHQFQRETAADGSVIAERRDYELAREALQKIQTGSFVAMTRGQRRVFEACVEHNKGCGLAGFTAKELINGMALAKSNTYQMLDKLVERGLLMTSLESRVESSKMVTVYRPVMLGLQSLNLPSWETLLTIPELPEKPETTSIELPELPEKPETENTDSVNSGNSVFQTHIELPPLVAVVLTQAMPAFMASDGTRVGPFSLGQSVTLPTTDAELLINQGVARKVINS